MDDFFGGPAFLAWARMGNLHGWVYVICVVCLVVFPIKNLNCGGEGDVESRILHYILNIYVNHLVTLSRIMLVGN
jgi:hypothetical protein